MRSKPRIWPLGLLPVLIGFGGRFPGAAAFPGGALHSFRGSFYQEAGGSRGRLRHATVMADQFGEGQGEGALVGYHRVDRRLLASVNADELSVKQLTLVLLHDETQVRRDLLQETSAGTRS